MKRFTFYQYPKCSTCRKAQKFLEKADIGYNSVDITINPPTKKELMQVVQSYLDGNYKKLFNTSGLVYRDLGLKDKLAEMTDEDILNLLISNGRLIKRPILVGPEIARAGFKQNDWELLQTH